MYGNKTLPGISASEKYRDKNSIWRGYPESMFFKTVQVTGSSDTANALPAGTIIKEDPSTGFYSPISTSDIISATANLPGARLAIVADATAKTGTTTTTGEGNEAVTEVVSSNVVVGMRGEVDKTQLLVGDTAFTELTEAQQINLNTQLEAWGFMLVDVMQA